MQHQITDMASFERECSLKQLTQANGLLLKAQQCWLVTAVAAIVIQLTTHMIKHSTIC